MANRVSSVKKVAVERPVKKVGTSLIVRVTNELRMLNLDEGDMVKITLERV